MLSNKSRGPLNQHVSVAKKTLSVFAFPYFKDKQIYHAPANPDTLKKKENRELDPWIEYPKQWNLKVNYTLMNLIYHP